MAKSKISYSPPISVTQDVPPEKEIKKARLSIDKKWSFSFQYWHQQEKYFGLKYKDVNQKWFVSLLESLRDLSSKPIEEYFSDGRLANASRFHPINWTLSSINRNVFFERIPYNYNTDEIEALQFQITTSKGRVIGFFDSEYIFQIVLLDPAHNMQLSSYNNYKTVKTDILPNDYNDIVEKFNAIVDRANTLSSNRVPALIRDIQEILNTEGYSKNKTIIINENLFDTLNDILELCPDYPDLEFIVAEAVEMLMNALLEDSDSVTT